MAARRDIADAGRSLLWLTAALVVVSCGGDVTGVGTPPPLQLDVVAGENATATVGEAVEIVIRVTSDGQAAASRPVRLEPGTGTVEPANGSTDAAGEFRGTWTLGTVAGEQTLVVRVGEHHQRSIRVEGLPGPAETLRLSQRELRLTGVRETSRLTARVEDRFGNPVAADEPEWTTLDVTVAEVDDTGRITARGRGSTKVVARMGGAAEAPLSDTVAVEVEPRGAVTLTFDDGWKTTYTRAFPVLQAHGLVANVAVVPASVTWSGYLSLQELQALDGAGWSIVSHSVSHRRLTELSDDELERELRESREWIEGHGFRGSTVFVVPYHDWGDRELAAVRRHYSAARGFTVSQSWPETLVEWRPADPYGLTGLEAEFEPFTTPEGRAAIRAYLDRVVDEDLFLDLFFHDIPEEMLDGFAELVKILAEYSEWIRPYHELFPPPDEDV